VIGARRGHAKVRSWEFITQHPCFAICDIPIPYYTPHTPMYEQVAMFKRYTYYDAYTLWYSKFLKNKDLVPIIELHLYVPEESRRPSDCNGLSKFVHIGINIVCTRHKFKKIVQTPPYPSSPVRPPCSSEAGHGGLPFSDERPCLLRLAWQPIPHAFHSQ